MENKYNLVCPACENKLSTVLVGDIVIDVCQGGCAGIWFDKDEMQKIDGYKADEDIIFHLKKRAKIFPLIPTKIEFVHDARIQN